MFRYTTLASTMGLDQSYQPSYTARVALDTQLVLSLKSIDLAWFHNSGPGEPLNAGSSLLLYSFIRRLFARRV